MSKMDPAIAALRGAIGENTYVAESVNCMVALLRAHGALRDEDMRLPPGAGMSAVARRIRTALNRIEAPDPGFAIPEPFHLLKTSDELQRIARSFENCLALPQWSAAKYHVNLVMGTTVFLASEEPSMLAALHFVAPGVWNFEQCAGPKNSLPPPGARSALLRGLAAAGLRIVETDPHSALARIEQEATRARGGEVDLDDYLVDDGDDDEIAA